MHLRSRSVTGAIVWVHPDFAKISIYRASILLAWHAEGEHPVFADIHKACCCDEGAQAQLRTSGKTPFLQKWNDPSGSGQDARTIDNIAGLTWVKYSELGSIALVKE